MSKEELLMPRLKVMFDFPDSDYEVGQIIEFKSKSSFYTGTDEWQSELSKSKNGGRAMRCIKYFEPFPLIFKPMEWWEDRKPEDMPKYVKSMADKKGGVFKIQEWDMEMLTGWIDKKERSCCSLTTFKPEYGYFPATEQEYNEYRLLNP